MNALYEEIVNTFGPDIGRWSVASPEGGYPQMVELLDQAYEGGPIVEIGTWCGVSTCLLAQYAPKVITIDILPRTFPERQKPRRYPEYEEGIWRKVWKHMGVEDIIEERIIDPKEKLVINDHFTLAFIDGDHTYKGVSRDFDAVKHCGQVIFHDYKHRDPPVTKFVDSLSGRITENPPLALWRA